MTRQTGDDGGRVAHQLVDHPGRDAGVLQPGRERVPEVMQATHLQAEQALIRRRRMFASDESMHFATSYIPVV